MFTITTHFIDNVEQDSWSETDVWDDLPSVEAYIAGMHDRYNVTLVAWTGAYSVELNAVIYDI